MRVSKRRHSNPYDIHEGRRGGNTRLPLKHRGKNPALLFAALSLVLLIAAGAVYLAIYREGDTAGQNAQSLLTEYNRAVSPKPSAAFQTAPASYATAAQTPAASLLPGDYVQPAAPDADPSSLTLSLPGYDVIGKLTIEKIGVELPVIFNPNWSDSALKKALKVSVCWYQGALPGEPGNMVITGHNYANGAHFGKLDRLAKGDKVVFMATDGNTYTYIVYETQTVTPDNAAALDKYEGDSALTLLTCASSGNRRLIVRCKLAGN